VIQRVLRDSAVPVRVMAPPAVDWGSGEGSPSQGFARRPRRDALPGDSSPASVEGRLSRHHSGEIHCLSKQSLRTRLTDKAIITETEVFNCKSVIAADGMGTAGTRPLPQTAKDHRQGLSTLILRRGNHQARQVDHK
jgi:hypothetical protein